MFLLKVENFAILLKLDVFAEGNIKKAFLI